MCPSLSPSPNSQPKKHHPHANAYINARKGLKRGLYDRRRETRARASDGTRTLKNGPTQKFGNARAPASVRFGRGLPTPRALPPPPTHLPTDIGRHHLYYTESSEDKLICSTQKSDSGAEKRRRTDRTRETSYEKKKKKNHLCMHRQIYRALQGDFIISRYA